MKAVSKCNESWGSTVDILKLRYIQIINNIVKRLKKNTQRYIYQQERIKQW